MAGIFIFALPALVFALAFVLAAALVFAGAVVLVVLGAVVFADFAAFALVFALLSLLGLLHPATKTPSEPPIINTAIRDLDIRPPYG